MTIIRRLKVVRERALTKVLCIFAYTRRHGPEVETFEDSIMLYVATSTDILAEFEAAMYRLRTQWDTSCWRGKLLSTELLAYMPETQSPHF